MIGVGMGRNMLRIHDDAESTLVVRAICDLSLDAVRRVASEHNREALFETGDYREILDRFDTDVVGIYSLDHLRMQHLRDALESGKQFIGTKPMVISLKEAKATVDPVRKTEKNYWSGRRTGSCRGSWRQKLSWTTAIWDVCCLPNSTTCTICERFST